MHMTIAEALREMRDLQPADAGRLHGMCLRGITPHDCERLLSATPQPWRDQLRSRLRSRMSGDLHPDSPEYLVQSDGVPIAVLTAAARIELPDYPLSPLQTRHQRDAAAALGDLGRSALRELADQRAHAEGRDQDVAAESERHPGGALRVAPAADPTNAAWVHISADLARSRRNAQVIGRSDPEQILILTAAGYGGYGHTWHRPALEVLCAMHRISEVHGVTLSTVGDWLAGELPTDGLVDPQTIIEQFAAAYIGSFGSEVDYVGHRLAELGWPQALAAAGIPERYLDLPRIARDWFGHQVDQIRPVSPDGFMPAGHIEVFRRHPA